MTVLVTGATGLIGARLFRASWKRGSVAAPSCDRGKSALRGGGGGGRSSRSCIACVGGGGISAIIHLAAVFRTPDTDLIWRSNLEGTRNLIAAVKAHAPEARFILASTSNIYDADSPRPGCEDDAADPRQAYPGSKLAAENALRESGLNWSIQRFGFVYGDKDGHLEELPRLVANFKNASRPEDEHGSSSRYRHGHEPRPGRRAGRAHRQYR